MMEDKLSFQDVLTLIKQKSLWLILSVILTVTGILFITNIYMSPKYSATTELALGITNEIDSDLNDVNLNLIMMNTYESLIKSSAVLTEVQKQHPEYSVSDLKSMVAVVTEEDSQIFSIVVSSNDPEKAAGVANTIAVSFKKKAKELIDNQQKISVISPAEIPQKAIFPNQKASIVLGVFLGLVLGLLGIAINLAMDKTVKSEEYVKELLDMTHLGNIGRIKTEDIRIRKN